MDLDKFLADLKELDGDISSQAALQGDAKNRFAGIQGIFGRLDSILPGWFFFIEQTEIGTKEDLLAVLSDLEEAMRTEDSILLADTLLYGLQTAVQEYIAIISGAMDDE